MAVATFFRNIIESLNKSHSISSSCSENIHLFIRRNCRRIVVENCRWNCRRIGTYLSLLGKIMMIMIFMFLVGRKGWKKRRTERGYFERCFHVSPQKRGYYYYNQDINYSNGKLRRILLIATGNNYKHIWNRRHGLLLIILQ